MHRRGRLLGAFLGCVLMLTAGCGADPAASDLGSAAAGNGASTRTIRIAHQNDAAILIAQAKGWFEEEFSKDGTEVVYNRFIAGPPIMEAFSAGRQDVGIVGDMPPVSAKATGVDVQVVGSATRNADGYSVVVRQDSSFQSVEDLKGASLAAQVGSAQHHYALLLLNQRELTDQVRLVNIPLTELRTTLEAGTVDAVVAGDYLAGLLEYEGTGRVLPDSVGVKPGLSFYVTRSQFAQENPDLVERFLTVISRANEYIKSNPTEAAALAEQESDWPAPVLEKVFQNTDYDIRLQDEDIRQLEAVRDFLLDNKVIRSGFAVTDLVDSQYAEAVAN